MNRISTAEFLRQFNAFDLIWDEIEYVEVEQKNDIYHVKTYYKVNSWASEFKLIYHEDSYKIHGMYKFTEELFNISRYLIIYYQYGIRRRANAPCYRAWNEHGELKTVRWSNDGIHVYEQNWANNVLSSEYWKKNGKTHRLGAPASISWHPNGQKSIEAWCVEGNIHREDGPAYEEWHKNGKKRCVKYYRNDIPFCYNGPSEMRWFDNGNVYMMYWHNGKNVKKKEWFRNGTIRQKTWLFECWAHREGKPAVIEWYPNGQMRREAYCIRGSYHCEDEPAVRRWNEHGQLIQEKWYLKEKRHREDGPAVREWNNHGQLVKEKWFEHGFEYELVLTKRSRS